MVGGEKKNKKSHPRYHQQHDRFRGIFWLPITAFNIVFSKLRRLRKDSLSARLPMEAPPYELQSPYGLRELHRVDTKSYPKEDLLKTVTSLEIVCMRKSYRFEEERPGSRQC